ncbi:MAG: glycosyltransferase family 2 protein [Candidatus Aphodosoma sp.]
MKLSIIIPVYQVEEYIERCLKSIISQDCKDYEIILVDDATRDNSMKIAHDVLDNTGTIVRYLKHESNSGLSAARNSGISVAKGEYILFVDSDDSLADGALSAFIRQINDTHADCIIGNYKVVSEKGDYISKKYDYYRYYDATEDIHKAYLLGNIPVMAWNKCVKTDLIRKNNLFFKEGIYHEDELWTFLLINEVASLVVTGIYTYTYYVRGGSIMTNAKMEKRLQSSISIYAEMVEYVTKNNVTDVNIINSLDVFAFWRYRDICKLCKDKTLQIQMYDSVRFFQKKSPHGNGKFGAVARFNCLLPRRMGYLSIKLLMALYNKQ